MSGSEELAEITEGRGRSAEEDKAGVCLGEACSSRDVTVSVLPSIKKPCHHLQGHFNSCVFERSLQSPESRCDMCVHACVGVLRDTLARAQVCGVRPAGSAPFMPDGRAGRPAGGRLVTLWAPPLAPPCTPPPRWPSGSPAVTSGQLLSPGLRPGAPGQPGERLCKGRLPCGTCVHWSVSQVTDT